MSLTSKPRIAALALAACIALPMSASAEALYATIASLTVKENANYRQISVRVAGPRSCGNNAPDASLYWRDSNSPNAYEDGVKLLTAALLSQSVVLFDLTDTGSSCRVNGVLVTPPADR